MDVSGSVLMTPWQPWIPDKDSPWNWRRAVHLHRRTVFGATWAELQRDLQDSPENAVNRVLTGACRRDGVPSDFQDLVQLIGNAAADSGNVDRIKASWIYRCLFSPDPLQERLTLMWHNHFATSNTKVDDLQQMTRQNDTLRNYSRAEFGDLLKAMLQDPALLIWLDADANRSGRANENLARELMELFTLGIGNYTESDVKQAARALTGMTRQTGAMTMRKGEFRFQASRHDSETKTILGMSANFDADQLADLLLLQPATATRLAWRLTQEFFGEGVVDGAALEQLSGQLRDSNLNIAQAVETILHSQLFFSEANISTRVCDPMSFLIAPLRAFEMFDPSPGTLLLADWLRQMGLDLYYPPNVGGWNSGRTWLNTRTMIARTNYLSALVQGRLRHPVQPPDFRAVVDKHCPERSLSEFCSLVFRGTGDLGDAVRSDDPQSLVQQLTLPISHLH